ncbi:MAG: hypothetical protein AAB074_06000 [Planctomycetota bacterium]
MPDLKDIILGNIAVERGLVERPALLELQKQQRDTGLPLGQVMLRAGLVNGPKLIELMKLVSVTIEHLDGGLEVGADSVEAPGPPGLLVGAANEPSRAPRDRNEIPVVPAVGGTSQPQRPQAPRTGAIPAAASGSPGGARGGNPTPKPMPSPGLADDGVGTKTPAPVPSPFEQTPRPVPPSAKPRTGRFDAGRAIGGNPASAAGYKPKTEAFDFGKVDASKPRDFAAGGAPSAQKPKSGKFENAPAKPPTNRFDAARAGGRTPSEAFRVELAERDKKSDVPQVQGAFGQSVTQEGAKKKDNTRLYTPVDIPKATPAGKLPPEPSAPGDSSMPKDDRISVPPGAREQVAGMKEGDSTLSGRLPAGIDADSKPLASPLDDVSIMPPGAPAFEMPPGGAAASAPKGRPSQAPAPVGRPSRAPLAGARPSRAPGSGPIPTAAAEGAHRMAKPDDSGFIAASNLPDFEVRASDQPGGKPVVLKNPKAPEPPKKETRKLGAGKGPLRTGLKSTGASPSGSNLATAEKTKEGAEEPKKRSRRLLAYLLVVLALILGAAGTLFYIQKLKIDDFKHLKDGFRDIPDTLKDKEYWKRLFIPDSRHV